MKEGFGRAAGTLQIIRGAGGGDEEIPERSIHAIADQAVDTGGVVLFPKGIDGQRDIDRPAGQGAGRQQDGVADRLVAGAALVEHAGKHRDIEVGVIVDADLALAIVEAMEAAGILGDDAAPGDRHGEEQGVEPRVVETFADEFAGGDHDARFIFRNGCEPGHRLAQGFPAHAALQDDQMGRVRPDQLGEDFDMLGALRENKRRAAFAQRGGHIVADHRVARFRADDLGAEILVFQPPVGIRFGGGAEPGGTDDHVMGKGPGVRLLFGIHAMADRAALHEDDRVMAVFPRDGSGQPEHEAGLRAAGDEFETVGGEVMAFIDDQVPVVRHAVIDGTLADQALDQRDIDPAAELLVPATEPANRLGGQPEERGETFDPLF